ncbi:MAG: pyridoxal phosphate-dependent decarboxylase family protein [Rhodospirillaceae bacterium]
MTASQGHRFPDQAIKALVTARSAKLGAPDVLAHMDPAPADIAAKLVGLNAQFNQNLLHPDLSPFATEAEQRVISWLAPYFGMSTGHICAGSTLANLTALWCARKQGARRVVASKDAHISVPKSADILGMSYDAIPVDPHGRLDRSQLPDLSDAALVLTAGTTGRGVVDDLALEPLRRKKSPLWTHVDAAWAGPLRLTCHGNRLAGIEQADSVCVSAHKWLFQPKDSALVFFHNPDAQNLLAFGSAYLASPNIGIQGSRSAAGVALLGTLLAWGRSGLEAEIIRCLSVADHLADRLAADPRAELKQRPETGVLNWRPCSSAPCDQDAFTDRVIKALGPTASRTAINGEPWLRHVSANLFADEAVIWQKIDQVLEG